MKIQVTIAIIILVIMFTTIFIQERDCSKKGGKLVQGLYKFECIEPNANH